MKPRFLTRTAACAALVTSAAVAQQPAGAKRLDIGTYLDVRLPSALAWSPDGRRIAYQLTNANGDEIRVTTVESLATKTLVKALPRRRFVIDRPGLAWTADGRSLFFRQGPQYFRVDIAGGGASPVLSDTLPREIVQVSPSRNAISFIRQGDIWVQQLSGGPPRQLTRGEQFLAAGRAESFGRLGQWPEWSPDGTRIAFASPLAGGLRIGIVDVATAVTRWIGSADPQWSLIRADWSPDGTRLAIARLNNAMTRKQLVVVSDTGDPEIVIRDDRDEKWIAHNIEPEFGASWSPDGKQLLFISIRTGWRHLYMADPATGAVRQLTDGPYDVSNVHWSPDGDRIAAVSNRDDPQSLRVWSLSASDGAAHLLGADRGISIDQEGRGDFPWPVLSPDGKRVAFAWSGPTDPYQVRVADMTDGRPPAVVYSALKDGFDPAALARMETVSFSSADGTLIRALLYRPHDRQAASPHIGVIHMYGGWGQLATVGWGIPLKSRLFQYLASQGIVTLVVDPRGSDGYGAAFAHGLFHDAAGKQSEDLAAAARFLADRGYADAKRIALYGHSYAGFLTLSTMEQYPNLFGAGVLQAGVFDFPSFIPLDVPYALIRFGTPDLYQSRGRPALHLDRLKGPVLVAHGSGDFNAAYSNSELLVNELMKANKDFEFITYPNERHGWERTETDRDFLRRVSRFLERTLAGNR